jgi:hypothetical protein
MMRKSKKMVPKKGEEGEKEILNFFPLYETHDIN